jgi:hypothetical protein
MTNNIDTEISTLKIMLKIYCKGNNHSKDGICDNCKNILEYSINKTLKCVYKENKPICNKCRVHCYNNIERENIINIMRYSGPKMLFRHPYLAMKHMFREIFS